jgi:hypothetical protein
MRYALYACIFLTLTTLVLADGDTEASQCFPTETEDITTFAIPYGLILFGIALIALWHIRGTPLFIAIFGALFIIFGLGILWFNLELNSETVHFGVMGSAHHHADFAVVINNKPVDFTNDYYLSYLGHVRSRYVHLHNPDNVIHIHAQGVTWEYVFRTLNVTMNDKCIQAKDTSYCQAGFVINGRQVNTLGTPVNDGDRALFHFGEGNASLLFDQAVGDKACLYSGTCPERGVMVGCSN